MNSPVALLAPDGTVLSPGQTRNFLGKVLDPRVYADRKILMIIPDRTRSGPFHRLVRQILRILKPLVPKIDILIALGTHPLMTRKQIDRFLKITAKDRKGLYSGVRIFNHEWNNGRCLKKIGILDRKTVCKLTKGLFEEPVPVLVNRLIDGYDRILVLGPVFPHEVVGFSGGWKYFFPGICGPEFLNFFHWLGAVITNAKVNGVIRTPVRDVIHEAAKFIKTPASLVALDILRGEVSGMFHGDMIGAWEMAARRAEKTHIHRTGRTYKKVLGIAPALYDDLWTAGKVMYKLEPVVEDGGELIIYAPRVTEVSYTHGKILDRIGYHVRDYFLRQPERFKGIPRGVMAHSTHVKGAGTYVNGHEKPRIRVTLATGIPESRCRRINLGFLDWRNIDPGSFGNREKEGILLVRNAGEILYRP